MTSLREQDGIVRTDKLDNSLVDPNRIPYVQMNKPRTVYWSTFDKTLFWAGPLIIFLGISVLLLVVTQQETFIEVKTRTGPVEKSTYWDELKFTQLWGYSSCLQFKDKHYSNDVTCRFEDKPSFWSIHGIWPNREGSEGPNFCSKVEFDIKQLDPIRPSLDQYWYEIDNTKQGDYFWSHEWTKHGSCAKEESKFDTELKYFTAGLDLRNKYDLSTMLKNANVIPENPSSAEGYDVGKIIDAIQNSIGSTNAPYVQCLRKKNAETDSIDYYLLAVELCFDKELQLITCSSKRRLMHPAARTVGDTALPCPHNTPIKYLDNSL